MNANRIIDMIVRQVMRRIVNKGLDKGFDMASRMGGKSDQDPSAPRQAESNNAKHPTQGIKQAQKMSRQMRRFMKF